MSIMTDIISYNEFANKRLISGFVKGIRYHSKLHIKEKNNLVKPAKSVQYGRNVVESCCTKSKYAKSRNSLF